METSGTKKTTELPNIPPYKAHAYEQVLDSSRDWPIVQLNTHRDAFMASVVKETMQVMKRQTGTRRGATGGIGVAGV